MPAGFAVVLGWLVFRIIHFPPFAEFLIATEAEMNKVSWTNKDDLIRATTVVLMTVVLMAVFLFVVDTTLDLHPPAHRRTPVRRRRWIRLDSLSSVGAASRTGPASGCPVEPSPCRWNACDRRFPACRGVPDDHDGP